LVSSPQRGINAEAAAARKMVFSEDEKAAKRADVAAAFERRPKRTEAELPIALHGAGVDKQTLDARAKLNALVLTKDVRAADLEREKAAFAARGGAATVADAPVDHSQQRSDGAVARWVKIHFVDHIVQEVVIIDAHKCSERDSD
jgi:hypothetical protein